MERRLFDNLVVPPGPGGGTRRAVLLPLSLVLHVVVLGVVVLAPLLASEELPPLASPTPGCGFIPATLVPPPPPPRGVSPADASRRHRPAAAPAPAPSGAVLSLPTSPSDLPPADDPGWGLTDMPVCEGCVHWGVDGGAPTAAAPPPPPAAPVFRTGGQIAPPLKVRDKRPEYPELARTARVEGVVVIECRVDAEGDVVDTQVLSGHPLLSAAALDAVRQWRYRPTLLNGHRVSVIMTVTVRFQLRR